MNVFATEVSEEYLGKIILMRAKTPDHKSRMIVGAVILGAYAPDAPRDPFKGYVEGWPFPYAIQCYIPFSKFRCFSCPRKLLTWAGGNPKRLGDSRKEKAVIGNARRALQVVCGLRPDSE